MFEWKQVNKSNKTVYSLKKSLIRYVVKIIVIYVTVKLKHKIHLENTGIIQKREINASDDVTI